MWLAYRWGMQDKDQIPPHLDFRQAVQIGTQIALSIFLVEQPQECAEGGSACTEKVDDDFDGFAC